MGFHGNHALSHSPNRFILGTFFHIQDIPGNNLAPMKNCPGGCKVGPNRSRGTCKTATKFIVFILKYVNSFCRFAISFLLCVLLIHAHAEDSNNLMATHASHCEYI